MAKKRKIDDKPQSASSPSLEFADEQSIQEEPETLIEETTTISPTETLIEETTTTPPTETLIEETTSPTKDSPLTDQQIEANPLEDDQDPASIEKLLEPFSKDQLISLLKDAALKHSDICSSILQTADADPSHRKVFVHGFGWNTTVETLTGIFSQYGDIEDCNAVVDKITGKSKGYGFILFKHRGAAQRALEEPQKKIGNRMAACQLASIGPVPVPPPVLPVSEYTQRKIYVSNVGADLDVQKIVELFSRFGEIEEGPLGLDKATGKPKGFCLFVYRSVESAKKALEEPHKNLEGHMLHCQKAIDGSKHNKQGSYVAHTGFHRGSSGFGVRGPQIGMPSSIGGSSAHLIAPPAANIGFNNPGLMMNNGGHALKSAFGNQVGGTGGYMKPGVMGGYGASQVHGSYGGVVMGQSGARTQQGFGHVGGVGPYIGP